MLVHRSRNDVKGEEQCRSQIRKQRPSPSSSVCLSVHSQSSVSFCLLLCCFASALPKRQAKLCPARTCPRPCTKDRFWHDRKSDGSAREQTDSRACLCCVYRARALRSV